MVFSGYLNNMKIIASALEKKKSLTSFYLSEKDFYGCNVEKTKVFERLEKNPKFKSDDSRK